MFDETETIRRAQQSQINIRKAAREALEAQHGQVWDTQQLSEDFEVSGFLAPYVGVIRKSDRRKGSLCFQHDPRFYFAFEPHSGR